MINFLKKTKNFIQKKFKKEEPNTHANEDISSFVLSALRRVKSDPKEVPSGLSEDQWDKALSMMIEAWDIAHRDIRWKTQSRKRNQKIKVLLGFKLFTKYYKNIK